MPLSTTALWLFLMLLDALARAIDWRCPEFNETAIACSCDFPHTLRCSADISSIVLVPKRLRTLAAEESVSLLDCTVQNMTFLPGFFLEGVALHGLVVTSGELRNISEDAFRGLLNPLQALGLPNNHLEDVPAAAFSFLNALERLDLSHNFINRLDSNCLRGLGNLTFLDLSDNRISDIAADAFASLKKLKVLKLARNRVAVATVSTLTGPRSVEELDLSTNALAGPLRSDIFPRLSSLRTLNLADNQFTSISKGALTGASSLLALSLNHNHIDVLEDHAFRELRSLGSLDLSNNRIVAISGSSLAHLTELKELDLSHNFLRALTGDIFTPLSNLKVLRLDDNDISMVVSEGLTKWSPLERLTLSDNPLNCDCTLADFAAWFNNATRFSVDDRSTAVCMTPPHLENALLMEVPPNDLQCDDTDVSFPDNSVSAHVSGAQIVLRAFNFDGAVITLLWSIDSEVQSFSCDALFVYEETSTHEMLLNSIPLRCNSSQLVDPTTLVIRLPLGNMQPYHRYRFCVVLLEDSKFSDEMQLVLGCSEVIPLVASEKSVPQPSASVRTRIAALHANVSFNVLAVSVQLRSDRKTSDFRCHVTVTVFTMGTILTQHVLNCSHPKVSISGLPQGHYHVCATLGNYPTTETKLHCVTVKAEKLRGTSGSLLIVCFVLLSVFLFLGLYILVRKAMRRSRLRSTTHQCFLAGNELEYNDRKQHSRYVKLQTTTVM